MTRQHFIVRGLQDGQGILSVDRLPREGAVCPVVPVRASSPGDGS
ncbi:MAG: hypothetical protein ABJC74_08485 [Gemmatimonadota bacterium]